MLIMLLGVAKLPKLLLDSDRSVLRSLNHSILTFSFSHVQPNITRSSGYPRHGVANYKGTQSRYQRHFQKLASDYTLKIENTQATKHYVSERGDNMPFPDLCKWLGPYKYSAKRSVLVPG